MDFQIIRLRNFCSRRPFRNDFVPVRITIAAGSPKTVHGTGTSVNMSEDRFHFYQLRKKNHNLK